MIQITHATLSQVAQIDDLLSRLDFSKDSRYFRRCLEEGDEARQVFLASCDGQTCGLVVLNFKSPYPAFHRLNIPEIQDLNVERDFRRQGVGAELIRACEAAARGAGHDMIGIGVGLTSAYGNAQRLYSRLGYLPDGAGVYYDGRPVIHGEMRPIDDSLCLMMTKDL